MKKSLPYTLITSLVIEESVDAGFPQAVVFAREQYEMAMVHKSADESGCHLFVVKDVDPSGDLEVSV